MVVVSFFRLFWLSICILDLVLATPLSEAEYSVAFVWAKGDFNRSMLYEGTNATTQKSRNFKSLIWGVPWHE